MSGGGVPGSPWGFDGGVADRLFARVRRRRPAAVVSLGCVPVDPGNGVTGVVVRVSLTYDLAEPQAPATLVAKFSDPDPEFRAMVHSMGFFEREVRFYSEFAADIAGRGPALLFRRHRRGAGLVAGPSPGLGAGPERQLGARVLVGRSPGGRRRYRLGARRLVAESSVGVRTLAEHVRLPRG